MSKIKVNIAVCFRDKDGNNRFMFNLLNYGKTTDEVKFSFNKSKDNKTVIATEEGQVYPDDSLIRSFAELSYHDDGSLLWKYPQTKKEKDVIRKNPHGKGSRRTPLKEIGIWEPVFMGNIIRYKSCPIDTENDSAIIIDDGSIFNEEPFEYHVFLGNKLYQTPPNNNYGELVYRLNNITEKLDMTIWVMKSSYHGQPFMFGDIQGWNDNNRVKISEPRFQVINGSIQIDLKMLMNTEWNGNVVDEKMKLNISFLKKLPPMTMLCKAYLLSNPYLNQIEKLVGFNKGFSLAPFYEGIDLKFKMIGILDKDEKGSFLGVGTKPLENSE